MRAALTSAGVAIGAMLAASGGARGQEPEAQVDDVEQRAVELFENGERAYFDGDYEQAIYYLEQAVALRPNPVLLYNLARAYERADGLDEAIDSYRAYLASSPEAADRATIEARIASLERERVERAAAKARVTAPLAPAQEPATTTTAPERSPAPDARMARGRSGGAGAVPWIVAGVGVLGVGAGAGLWFAAAGAHDKAVREPVQARAHELQSNAEDLTVAGNVTFVAGGAVLLVGVLWGVVDVVDVVDGDSGEEHAGAPRLRLGPGAVRIEGAL